MVVVGEVDRSLGIHLETKPAMERVLIGGGCPLIIELLELAPATSFFVLVVCQSGAIGPLRERYTKSVKPPSLWAFTKNFDQRWLTM